MQLYCVIRITQWGTADGYVLSFGKRGGLEAKEFAKAKLKSHGVNLDPSDPRTRVLMNDSALYDPVQVE